MKNMAVIVYSPLKGMENKYFTLKRFTNGKWFSGHDEASNVSLSQLETLRVNFCTPLKE